MDEKTAAIRILVSEKDKRAIEKRAAARGFNTSAWLRMIALEAPEKPERGAR